MSDDDVEIRISAKKGDTAGIGEIRNEVKDAAKDVEDLGNKAERAGEKLDAALLKPGRPDLSPGRAALSPEAIFARKRAETAAREAAEAERELERATDAAAKAARFGAADAAALGTGMRVAGSGGGFLSSTIANAASRFGFLRVAMWGVVGLAGGALAGALAAVAGWLEKGAAATPQFQEGLERLQGATSKFSGECDRTAAPIKNFLGSLGGGILEGVGDLLDGASDAMRGFNDASSTAARASEVEDNMRGVGAAAGAWFQADDVTPPIYFYTRNDTGELSLIRGQWLPMICVRSAKILGFVLIMSGQYDSLAIRELITRVSLVHGLPGRGFHFENGLWRSAKILAGSKSALPWEEADRGLRALGMEIIHARLPRGKVIENVIGILQNQMERAPGYCGRDERNDKFERLQKRLQIVRGGHEPVEKHFLSEDGAMEMFGRIVERYNAEPQEGRLNGLSPDQAWKQFQSKEPRQGFNHRTAWILACDVRRVRVTGNGITIRIGKRVFNYKSDETAARVGETIVARFNPACPDILPFQSPDDERVVFAELCPETPAYGAGEIFEENKRRIAAHDAQSRRRYHIVANSLPTECFRVNLVDTQTAETAHRIDIRQRNVKFSRDVRAEVEDATATINMRVQPGTRVTQDRARAARKLAQLLNKDNDQ